MNSRTMSPLQEGSVDAAPAASMAERLMLLCRCVRARLATSLKPCRLVLMAGGEELQGDMFGDMPRVIDSALASFDDWCRAHPGSVCELALSSAWLLTCVSPTDWSDDAVHEQAVRQWAHYAGVEPHELASGWLVQTLKTPRARLACAMPQALMRGLEETARAHGVRLAAVTPWWLQAAQAWFDGLGSSSASSACADGANLPRTWQLDLIEPGLATSLRASVHASGIKLDAAWSEACPETTSEPGITRLRMAPPAPSGDTPGQRHVWHSPQLDALLRGDLGQVDEVAA